VLKKSHFLHEPIRYEPVDDDSDGD
jgi:hypothetical protein